MPDPPVAAAQVEACLGELLGLCQRAEEFAQFVSAHAAAAGLDKAQADSLSAASRGGAFQVAVRELLSYYVHLVRCCGCLHGLQQ